MSLKASACGKVILLGEHAVVYGRPAIAVPLRDVRARARLEPGGGGLRVRAEAVGLDCEFAELPSSNPLRAIIALVLEHLHQEPPEGVLSIESEIPVASGLGSGAAVSTAIVRLLAAAFEASLSVEEVSSLVLEVERLHHGTPSGIDNAVIALEKPIYFLRGRNPEALVLGRPLSLVVAFSGGVSKTSEVVAGVRERRAKHPEAYEKTFEDIARLVERARDAILTGDSAELGDLMNWNQDLLRGLEVSTPLLDRLVKTALDAGALGAKLSGAGLGGNVIALCAEGGEERVALALKESGAGWLRQTRIWM